MQGVRLAVGGSLQLNYAVSNAMAALGGSVGMLYADGAGTNAITITVVNQPGTDPVTYTLGASPSAPAVPDGGPVNGQAWFVLALPQGFVGSVDSAECAATIIGGVEQGFAGEWLVAPFPNADAPVGVVVYATAAASLPAGSTLSLVLSGIGLSSSQGPTTRMMVGAFAWAVSAQINSEPGWTNDGGSVPQFWGVLTATALPALPLYPVWGESVFGPPNYSLSGDSFLGSQVGLNPGEVWQCTPNLPPVENLLTVALQFPFASAGSIDATSSTLFWLTAVTDATQFDPPLMTPDNTLMTAAAAALVQAVASPPGEQEWNFRSSANQPGLANWYYEATPGVLVSATADGTVTVPLVLGSLVSNVTNALPGYSAIGLSWTGVPGYLNGGISLPVHVAPAKPAVAGFTASVATASTYCTTIDLEWATFCCASVTITATANGTVQVLASGQPAFGSLSTTANPLFTIQPTATSVMFICNGYDNNDNLVAASNVVVNIEPLNIDPTALDISITALGYSAETGAIQTSYKMSALGAATSVTMTVQPGGLGSPAFTGSATAQDMVWTADALGGTMDVTIEGPGCLATTYSNVAVMELPGCPMPDPRLVVLTAINDNTGIHAWTPGMTQPQSNLAPFHIGQPMTFVTGQASLVAAPVSADLSQPRLLVAMTGRNAVTLYQPLYGASQGTNFSFVTLLPICTPFPVWNDPPPNPVVQLMQGPVPAVTAPWPTGTVTTASGTVSSPLYASSAIESGLYTASIDMGALVSGNGITSSVAVTLPQEVSASKAVGLCHDNNGTTTWGALTLSPGNYDLTFTSTNGSACQITYGNILPQDIAVNASGTAAYMLGIDTVGQVTRLCQITISCSGGILTPTFTWIRLNPSAIDMPLEGPWVSDMSLHLDINGDLYFTQVFSDQNGNPAFVYSWWVNMSGEPPYYALPLAPTPFVDGSSLAAIAVLTPPASP